MSMMLMVQAMKTKVGNPLRKLVLIKLADNASDDGECWPSYQHIADHCEIDRSTVRKHIKALEDMRFLRIENRIGPKGNSSNLYILTLDLGVGLESIGVGPKPTPPVGPGSTRTYHSFESVKEPILDANAPDPLEHFQIFWNAGLRKLKRKDAERSYLRELKASKMLPLDFSTMLASDIAERLKNEQFGFSALHPTSYLNGKRWTDEKVSDKKQAAITDRWWSSDEGITRKAAELGIRARPSENYRDLADRVRIAIDQKAHSVPSDDFGALTSINESDIPY